MIAFEDQGAVGENGAARDESRQKGVGYLSEGLPPAEGSLSSGEVELF